MPKITPDNYKELGYTSYQEMDEDEEGKPLKEIKYIFFVDLPDGWISYDDEGNNMGETN
jgi:hypothetical protein